MYIYIYIIILRPLWFVFRRFQSINHDQSTASRQKKHRFQRFRGQGTLAMRAVL